MECSSTHEEDQSQDEPEKRSSPERWSRLTVHPWVPSWKRLASWLTVILGVLTAWGTIYSVVGSTAAPGGQMFSLGLLCGLAYLAGRVVEFVSLPSLLGQLFAGIVLKNTGVVHFDEDYQYVTAVMRKASIVIIMTSAGLELDPGSLRQLGFMVFRLSVLPALAEGVALTWIGYLLLDLPWLWGAMLGSVMAAISPAVVIPCLYSLQRKGYDVENGISTLIIAAASLDDVIAISVFGVLTSIIFSEGDLTWRIIQGPVGLLIGLVYGACWGMVARYIPHKSEPHVVTLRTLMLVIGGLMAVIGSDAVDFGSAGSLGCILSAFVASYGWRQQGWSEGLNPVGAQFAVVWDVFEPVLFAFIGVEVDFEQLDTHTVGLGVATMISSLLFRTMMSMGVAYGGNFNLREKIFIAFAWFPKATVQAALGPVALDIVRTLDPAPPELMERAHTVLVVAVMGILLTAPLGAVFISFAGPRLLARRIVPNASHPDLTGSQI